MPNVQYYFDPDGGFVIEDYNHAKLFAGFFPGIAGKKGIPLWAFYVNRGQCLAGFGTKDKDGAIQEYVPADKAPWYTAWRGFRTILRLDREHGAPLIYEPFRPGNDLQWTVRTKLKTSPAALEINEINDELGLTIGISYFTLPEAPLAGLLRQTEITNHSRNTQRLQMVDGLAVIMPSGFTNFLAKNMGATIRAWMSVEFTARVPFYRLRFLSDDVPELYPVTSGNFYLGYFVQNDQVVLRSPVYDPELIFGPGTDYTPMAFAAPDFHYPGEQARQNHLPSALSYDVITLPPNATIRLYGLFGHAPGESSLRKFLPEVGAEFYEHRRQMNHDLVRETTALTFTHSGDPLFDRYLGQCFLDNTMRGGLPVTITGPEAKSPKVFWLYSRKHGDLERDYNEFRLSPTYYAQGNGNFRINTEVRLQ